MKKTILSLMLVLTCVCLNAYAAGGDWVWEYKTGDDVFSSPAVSGGYVYVGSDNNKVYCLDAATGIKIWEYKTGGDVRSSPAVSGGYVYVGSGNHKVYCLNAADGDSGSWPMFKNNNARIGAVINDASFLPSLFLLLLSD